MRPVDARKPDECCSEPKANGNCAEASSALGAETIDPTCCWMALFLGLRHQWLGLVILHLTKTRAIARFRKGPHRRPKSVEAKNSLLAAKASQTYNASYPQIVHGIVLTTPG